MVTIQEYHPSESLAPYVVRYYSGWFNTFAAPHQSVRIIPNGCLELIIHLKERYCQLPTGDGLAHTPDYMLIGLFQRTYEVHFSEAVPVFSIRFKPEALPHLLRIQGTEILESYEDIESLLGRPFRDFCHRIREEQQVGSMVDRAEQFLKGWLEKQQVADNYVIHAARLIRNTGVSNVQEISAKVNISQRQLERKFREWIGISPKQYLRLMRINKVIQTLEQNQALNLTDVAYHCGYFDQAHFIKDFKRITLLTPSDYVDKKGEFFY